MSDTQGVKEETFIQTGRRGGDGHPGRKNSQQGGSWRTWTRRSHFHVWVNQEEQQITQPRVPAWGNKASKPLTETPVGVEAAGETLSLIGEFVGETHKVLEHTQTHPPGNWRQKGPICLLVAEKVTKSWWRAEQVALFPLGSLPHIPHHNTAMWVAVPWRIPNAPPLTL